MSEMNLAQAWRIVRGDVRQSIDEFPGKEAYRYEALKLVGEAVAENARLKEANGILEDGLQEVGDDYPGSKKWCQQRIKAARAVLEAALSKEPT